MCRRSGQIECATAEGTFHILYQGSSVDMFPVVSSDFCATLYNVHLSDGSKFSARGVYGEQSCTGKVSSPNASLFHYSLPFHERPVLYVVYRTLATDHVVA